MNSIKKDSKLNIGKDEYMFFSKNKKNTQTQYSILNYFTKTQKNEKPMEDNNIPEKITKDKVNDIKVKNQKSPYTKKIVSKDKNLNSKINNQGFLYNKINDSNNLINDKEMLNENDDKNKKYHIINNEKKNKTNINISKISNKNFNETLFDYKKYSFINNNPHKRKSEFDEELKNTKKLKDILIKKRKKGWIKKTLFDKEKNKENKKNEKNIILDKYKNNNKKGSKINISNLNIINEEKSNRKANHKQELNNLLYNNEEKKKDDRENEFGELNMYNKFFKKSQDDFEINLIKEKESKKSFIDFKNIFNISNFTDYLKNKNPSFERFLNEEIDEKNVSKKENKLKFLEDKNIN